MLIKRRDLDRIAAGTVHLAFRRWRRPTVRTGGSLRTPVGVLGIDSLERVVEDMISEQDAGRAGFESREDLLAFLRRQPEGDIYRIELHLAGPDPRAALRDQATLSNDEVEEISRRLATYDTASRRGPWTTDSLLLIAEFPGTRAADMAAASHVEKDWLKGNVRKLKELGLTESLKVGYKLSPRGRAYLRCTLA